MDTLSTALYWSIKGHVACAHHAPGKNTPQWALERWAAIPHHALRQPMRYQCQDCASDGRAIGRSALAYSSRETTDK